jgi:hypothetical protein
MGWLLQDVVVTAIALTCVVVIVRRVLGVVRPVKAPGCAHCASSTSACAPAPAGDAAAAVRPLVVVRPPKP